MTGKVLVFISNTIKSKGRPGERKMIERLQPTYKTRQRKNEWEMEGLQHIKDWVSFGMETFRLAPKAFTSIHSCSIQMKPPVHAWRKQQGLGYWLCGHMAAWAVWLWRHWKLITAWYGATEAKLELWRRSAWCWPCSSSDRPEPAQEGTLLKWFVVLKLWFM